ncbi:sensor histidine kinase [Variovorax sp. LT1R20]|uniref:sensor histidine kinase n=1 Tax=Variovorax sp. LT1R20 TaxID=3443729 RepID=UPI003F48602D
MAPTYHFKTNTLLKNLVGKDLINDDDIAIVELVKNSYDAGSPTVNVKFERLSGEGRTDANSRLVIEDRGAGMTLPDIRDKWLNIAYSEKKTAPQENGAYYAGNKGIGRFSCDRLGTHLDLLTRSHGGSVLHLPISWPDFEIEGKKDLLIQDIPLFIKKLDDAAAAAMAGIRSFPAQGTILIISTLRSTWDRERLLGLKRSFEKFLNPNQLFQRDAFKITLNAPDLKKSDAGELYYNTVNGPIQNQVFEKLKFNTTYIESHVSAKDGVIRTELHHEGELVFKLTESSDAYPELEDTKIIVYYLNPYKKAYFTRQTGVRSIEFGSIFLFLNGFRVAPYGDRGNDWLSLDVRKTQGTTRYLSSRDIIGRIEVSDSRDAFQPVSSREGLKKTIAFQRLKEGFFFEVIRKLERFVVDGLDWDSVPQNLRDELKGSDGLDWENTSETYAESWERKQQRIALSIMTLIGSNPVRTTSFWFNPALLEGIYETKTEEVANLLAEIEGTPAEKIDGDLKKGLSRIRALLVEKEQAATSARKETAELKVITAQQQRAVAKLESEKETYRAQTLFLQSVAPTAIKDLVAFHHQISHDSTIAGNYLAKAIKALRDIPNSKPIIDFIEKASLANRRMAAVAQFASKANFRSGMKKEPTDIPAFIQQYLLYVAKDFTAAGLNLNVTNTVNEIFEIKASKVELSILIDNLISNAGKAMAKRLDVSIELAGKNNLDIRFCDDGRGLSPQIPSTEAMFEMGVTTTSGSGLGLYHARRIAESIDGKLTAKPRAPRGMEIRLELTR